MFFNSINDFNDSILVDEILIDILHLFFIFNFTSEKVKEIIKQFSINMSNKIILKTIKSIVHYFFPNAQILLFGSRARGDYNKNSDFDILIITSATLSPKEKKDWRIKIKKAILDNIAVPIDILINSEKEVAAKRNLPGHIVRWAMKEGIVI